jgi:hypothetical protein
MADPALRLFFEEMFERLTTYLSRRPDGSFGGFSRQDIVEIIAALILNAAPHRNRRIHNQHRARGVRLWSTLLSAIPESAAPTMERASLKWPAALRRRFLSGLQDRRRKRWPYTPYRSAIECSRRLKRDDLAVAYGLDPKPSERVVKFVWDLSAVERERSGI